MSIGLSAPTKIDAIEISTSRDKHLDDHLLVVPRKRKELRLDPELCKLMFVFSPGQLELCLANKQIPSIGRTTNKPTTANHRQA